MFRVITSASVTELLRFDITYIPGGNAIQLVNHTLVVREGHSQQVTQPRFVYEFFTNLRSATRPFGWLPRTIQILCLPSLSSRFSATLNC